MARCAPQVLVPLVGNAGGPESSRAPSRGGRTGGRARRPPQVGSSVPWQLFGSSHSGAHTHLTCTLPGPKPTSLCAANGPERYGAPGVRYLLGSPQSAPPGNQSQVPGTCPPAERAPLGCVPTLAPVPRRGLDDGRRGYLLPAHLDEHAGLGPRHTCLSTATPQSALLSRVNLSPRALEMRLRGIYSWIHVCLDRATAPLGGRTESTDGLEAG